MTETISRGDNVAGTLTREAPAAQPTPVPRPRRTRQGEERTRAARTGDSPRLPRQRPGQAGAVQEGAGQERAEEGRTAQSRSTRTTQARTARPRTAQARTVAAPRPAPTAPRPVTPRPAAPRPGGSRPAEPETTPRRSSGAARSVATALSPSAGNRTPFIVLLCGLLGGALVSALVINTTLAEGSFEINKLQMSDSALARQRQQLQDQVAQAQSAQVIEQRAAELGMRPQGQLQFVNLKTGKIETDAGSGTSTGTPGSAP